MVMKRRTYLASFLTLMLSSGIVVFNAAIFSVGAAHAVTFESEQGIAFTFNPTVTISITGGTGASSDGLTITNLTPGDVKDSNIITVSASANTPLGYSLSSTVGSSTYNTTELRKDGTSTANKFTNLTANVSSLSNFSDNTWGYSYSTDSGSTWISGDITSTTATGYNGLPIYTTSSPIKLINSSSAGSSSIQFKIGAKASTSQIAGTYNNVINFIGTSKVVTTTYTINYNDPSGEATVMPTPNPLQGTDTTGNAAVQISNTVPTRANYIFKGWCTASTTDDTCSGDTIQPGDYLALNPGTSSASATVTKTLYAMWRSNSAAPGLCTDAATCMQTMTSCPATATTVTDARDGKTYRVQQLTGGGCWMLDNLSLDPTTVSLANLKGNTNASDTTLEYLKGERTGTTSDKYPTAAVGYGDSSNYYSVPKVSVSGTCYSAYCVNDPESGKWTSETVTQKTINGTTSIAQGKVGIYYNYCAASAGSYCWGDGTASTGSPSSDPDTSTIRDVTEDLCPAGWHMPTSDTNGGEYNALYTAYNSDYTAFQTALVTPLSGGFISGTARGQGGSGYFWSSTWDSTDRMRRLGVGSSNMDPSSNDTRDHGYSVRCSLGS